MPDYQVTSKMGCQEVLEKHGRWETKGSQTQPKRRAYRDVVGHASVTIITLQHSFGLSVSDHAPGCPLPRSHCLSLLSLILKHILTTELAGALNRLWQRSFHPTYKKHSPSRADEKKKTSPCLYQLYSRSAPSSGLCLAAVPPELPVRGLHRIGACPVSTDPSSQGTFYFRNPRRTPCGRTGIRIRSFGARVFSMISMGLM